MNISILGAGAWGTALALALCDRHDVVLWARSPVTAADALPGVWENVRYLPGVALPEALHFTIDLDAALAHVRHRSTQGLVIVATSVSGLREVAGHCAQAGVPNLVWLCKGLEQGTDLMPHQVVQQVMGDTTPIAALSGPSFAAEVARGLPCALVVASLDPQLTTQVQNALHGGALRIYSSADMVGVEVGGAVKNIMAIATGISDGLGLGLNARAALITRGLAEMSRLGLALGGRAETFMGLSGMGDLILTCTGALSRNRKVGLELAAGKPLATVIHTLGHVAEGVRCAPSVLRLAHGSQISMPISESVSDVLFNGSAPAAMVQVLLARDSRAEH